MIPVPSCSIQFQTSTVVRCASASSKKLTELPRNTKWLCQVSHRSASRKKQNRTVWQPSRDGKGPVKLIRLLLLHTLNRLEQGLQCVFGEQKVLTTTHGPSLKKTPRHSTRSTTECVKAIVELFCFSVGSLFQ